MVTKRAPQEQALREAKASAGAEAEDQAARGGAEKERGTLNEDSRRQYQSPCFRYHDVVGACHARSLFLSNSRRGFDAEDRSAQCERQRLPSGRERGGSGKLDFEARRGERQHG